MTLHIWRLAFLCHFFLGHGLLVNAQAPTGDKEPLLQLEPGGPTALVTAVCFSPDGEKLYAAGFDKVVRVWERGKDGKYTLLREVAYRVPIGPGINGAINALALSPDGNWLAVGGLGMIREGAGFREMGWIWPATSMSPEMWQDRGTIHVFHTKQNIVRTLRGHAGPVIALSFVPEKDHHAPRLLSAAREREPQRDKYTGVVRLWDVSTGQQLGQLDTLPDPGGSRPGLSAVATGARLTDVQVALAWQDQKLRLWNVARNQVTQVPDGEFNNMVQHTDVDQLVTGSFNRDTGTGQLTRWKLNALGQPEVDNRILFPSVPGDDASYTLTYPRALAVQQGQALVITRKVTVQGRDSPRVVAQNYSLALVDLRPGQGGDVRRETQLWLGGDQLPALALTTDLRSIAVAGHPDHGIRVFELQQLARQAAPQVLGSSGTRWRDLGFVLHSQDQRTGLRLSTSNAGDDGQPLRLVFDFAQRRLIREAAGWQPFAPDLQGWSAKSVTEAVPDAGNAPRTTIFVKQNDTAVTSIRLKPRETITAFTLLPPHASGPLQIPVLAVAYLDATGQPLLSLFHGRTGMELRRLTAHQGPIRHLAFQGEGKFLASAGDDQTISLWTVSDLEQILDKFGQLAGVAIRMENEQLVIGRVDGSSMPGLQVGDIVEGLVQNNQLQRLGSTRDFYDALLLITPGQTTTLRVRQPRAQARDVTLPVTQAVDERKPLFSLFITQAATAEDREWIGWSPHGHYEAKDQQAERLLVWHFNTGQPEKPTTSAAAKDPALRAQFFKPRLLEYLIATGNLTDALERYRKPVAMPNMTLLVEQEAGDGFFLKVFLRAVMSKMPLLVEEEAEQSAAASGPVTVRLPRVQVKITIVEPALAELASLTWQLDNQPVQPIDLSRLTTPEFTLPVALSARQVHRVQVTAQTKEQQPKTVRREIALRYVPPRPVVRTGLQERQTVQAAQFPLRATIRAGSAGQAVQFTLQHEHQRQMVASLPRRVLAEDELAEMITLRPGENVLRFVAENHDATDATRGLERDSRTYVVILAPKKNDVPPTISLALRPDENSSVQTVVRDAVLTVHQPTVQVQGVVTASNQENLAKVQLLQGETNLLPAGEPKSSRDLRHSVTLQPGPNKFIIVARSDTSPEAALPFTVVYQPALPGLEVTSPRADEVLLDSNQTRLSANLIWGTDPQPCEAVLQVNQDPPQVIELQPGQNRLDIPIRLHPRNNRLHVQLRNRWGASVVLEPLFVSHLRPPRGLTVIPPEGGHSLATVTARVQSPVDLPLKPEFVTVKINGHPLPADNVALRQLAEGTVGLHTWFLRVKDVPLQEGEKNLFEIHVRNEEAGLKEPVQIRLTGPKPQGAPPIIEMVQPAQDTRVAEPVMKVQFRVRSRSDLHRLVLQIGDDRFELKDLEKVDENTYARQVKLKPGENALRVEAMNSIGLQSTRLTINYVALPVRVLLTEPVPIAMTEEQITLPQTDGGVVTLRGQVVWPVPPQQLPADARVKVYVNGFLQPPAPLTRTTDPRRFEFVTQAYLNQQQNRIEMELPGVAQERQRRQVVLVNCGKPERIRTRLLIVSVGLEKNQPSEAIQQRAVKLFQDQNHWPFVLAEPPVVLSGANATNGNVLRALVSMKSKIQRSAVAGSPRDIIVVYYAGLEVIDPQMGHFLLTASSRTDPRVDRSGVSLQFLEDLLGSTYGARMLLLDVLRPEVSDTQTSVLDRVAGWSEASPVAMARAAQASGGTVLDDFRLLSAWNDVLPKAERFRDIEDAVKSLLQPKANGTATIRQHLRPLAEVRLKGT